MHQGTVHSVVYQFHPPGFPSSKPLLAAGEVCTYTTLIVSWGLLTRVLHLVM